jgi:mannose-6-phosphate isomerase-like protein (cupin superfamily)
MCTHNRVAASFAAGHGSYAVALPNAGTAWVANAGNNTISSVSLKTGAVRRAIQLMLQPWLIQASPDGASVYVVTGMFTGSLSHFSSNLEKFKRRRRSILASRLPASLSASSSSYARMPERREPMPSVDTTSLRVSGGSSIHEHSHPQEEVYEVIEGELEVAIDGVSQIARAGRRPGHHRRLPATAAVVVLQQVFRGAGPRPAAASQAASFGCGAGVHASG